MTTLDTMETGTQTLMQRLGRPVTEVLMEAPLSEFSGVSRAWTSPWGQVDRRHTRRILGIFEDFNGACRRRHGSEALQDPMLTAGPGQASPKLAAVPARLAVDLPFDPVPDVMTQTLGLVIDGEVVRWVTENMGSWTESQEPMAIQEAPSEQNEDVNPSHGPMDDGMRFEPQADFLARWYAHALSVGLEKPSCRPIVLRRGRRPLDWRRKRSPLPHSGEDVAGILKFYHARSAYSGRHSCGVVP